MACSTCAQRRAMLAAAARRAKSGNVGEAARRIAEVAVHLVKHPPRKRVVSRPRRADPTA